MRRSILTAVFLFTLSASTLGVAAADESAPLSSPTMSVAPRSSTMLAERSAPFADAEGVSAASAADARFADPPLSEPAVAPVPIKHMTRLRRFASGIVNRSSAIASSLTRSAMRFIGTPYVFGGTHATGFDCSGYVQHVFALLGVHLPRTADAQFDSAHLVAAPMVPGDLVFFHTYAAGISHVGIYLGHNRFIHSSSSRGVAISSLHDRYWAPRYRGTKRVFGS